MSQVRPDLQFISKENLSTLRGGLYDIVIDHGTHLSMAQCSELRMMERKPSATAPLGGRRIICAHPDDVDFGQRKLRP